MYAIIAICYNCVVVKVFIYLQTWKFSVGPITNHWLSPVLSEGSNGAANLWWWLSLL